MAFEVQQGVKRFEFSSLGQGSASFNVVQFDGYEAISKPFAFDITLVSETVDANFDEILQNSATLIIRDHKGWQAHKYHGVVSEFEQLSKINQFVFYRAVLVPRFALLDLNKFSEVYLNEKNIPEIIEEVLNKNNLSTNDYKIDLEDPDFHRPRSFVGQYVETSKDFISRQMEKWGMYYFFDHSPEGHAQEKLIIADYKEAHPADVLKLRYCMPEDIQTEYQDQNVVALVATQRTLPRSVIVKDFNYRQAGRAVFTETETVSDNGVGEMLFHGNNLRTEAEAEIFAKIRSQELICQGKIFSGEATAVGIRSGRFIEITSHYRNSFNAQYLVTEVRHCGSQEQLLFKDLSVNALTKKVDLNFGTNYQCSFKAIPRDVQFRAPRVTPRPVIAGVISAVVDGEGSGQFAELDEFGQYKVQFFFDKSKKNPNKGSARLRMASPSSGANSGMHFPLLKGTEVLIGFTAGDPDQPVILAAVPDSTNPNVINSANHFHSKIVTPSGNRFIFSDETGNAGFELCVPGVVRMGSFGGKGTDSEA